MAAYFSGPSRRMVGTLASDSTLLMSVGWPHRPDTAGYGGRGRGVPRRPSTEAISAVSSPHTNAPAPRRTCSVKPKDVSMMLLAEVAGTLGQPDGRLQALDRERVLRPAVDIALVGVDREGRDGHALDDPEGVALEDAAIHERAGVALVGVADDVLLVTVGLGHRGPLETGRVAGAATAAQPGLRMISSRTSAEVISERTRRRAWKPPAAM